MQKAFEEMSKNLTHEIEPFPFDGELKRFKTKNGKYPLWAIGREWEYKGNSYQVIKYGDWRSGTIYTWKSYSTKDQSKAFVKKQREALEEIAAKEKYETQKKNKDCIDKWLPKFTRATKSEKTHDYLVEKQIKSNHLAKIDSNNTLMIPAYDQNGFVGCQLIYHSLQSDSYEKRFTSGIALKGSFCPFGDIRSARHIYVAEGFATAATIYEATDTPTICAWNCNNLHAAIMRLRLINPKCMIIIAADNDTKKESKNIGVKKAFFCKSRFSNLIVKVPKFEHFDSNNTDFNDLLIQESEKTVKEQLAFSESDFTEIIFLGHHNRRHYYYNSQSLQLIDLSASEHNKLNLLAIAPNKYWGDRYGFKKDRDGLPTKYLDIDDVVDRMFQEQRQVGFFNCQNIRGYGAWIDDDRIVINIGNHQIVDNEIVQKVPDSKYLYLSDTPMLIDWDNPLNDAECKKITNLFKMFNYKNPGDHIYLAAYVALAQIFNSIDWRFQLWITGEKGSGKTEIMKMMADLVPNSKKAQSVTAAGIRQKLDANAIPMWIDEAEPNSDSAKKRMDEVIELIRQCSSRTNAGALRGSASGKALEYNVNSIFCLASIQHYLPTQADVSRFFTVEMNPNDGSDIDQWNNILDKFEEVKNYGPRLFSRMIRLIPTLRQNIKTIKGALISGNIIPDPRQADQIGVAIASYFALETTELISHDDFPKISKIAQELNLGNSEYEQDNKVNEAENCLNTILEIATPNRSNTIGSVIQLLREKPGIKEYSDELAFYGIKFLHKENQLFIPANNLQLKRQLNNTMYYNYSKILSRHTKLVKKSYQSRVNGTNTKGNLLKLL